MPQDYSIDEQQQVIWTRCWGVLSDADIVCHQARLRDDPCFHPTLNQLVDARAVTEVKISAAAISKLGESTLFSPEAKRAYVVAQDALYGLVRMYEMHQAARGSEAVRVFRDHAVALAWLGVNEQASDSSQDNSKSA